MKTGVLSTIALALFALPAQAHAQSEARSTSSEAEAERQLSEFNRLLDSLFAEAPPLTAEQEAALPLARTIAAKLLPAGVLKESADETLGPFQEKLFPLFESAELPGLLAQHTGLSAADIASRLATDQERQQAAAIFDPAREERLKLLQQFSTKVVSDIMETMEPSYREGLSRALATRFSTSELNELSALFSTPVGARFAGESMRLYSDENMIAALAGVQKQIVPMVIKYAGEQAELQKKLPAERSYEELSRDDRQRLADLLGVDVKTLDAAAANAADDDDSSDYDDDDSDADEDADADAS